MDAAACISKLHYYAMYYVEHFSGSPVFEHDDATTNTFNTVAEYLKRKFGARWIRRRYPVNCPTRSPNLALIDFFFEVHVNDKLCSEPIQSFEHVKSQIRITIRIGDTDTLSSLRNNINTRIACILCRQG